MFGKRFARQKPNMPIEARTINRPLDRLEKLDRISVAAPLELQRAGGGIMIRDATPQRVWLKITSGTQPYAWQQVEPRITSGTLSFVEPAGYPSGTTTARPAYEINGNTAVPANKYVVATPIPTGGWLFEYGAC